MFERHVYSGVDFNTAKVSGGKVRCMHCPMYFRFSSSAEINREIIRSHDLVEIQGLPEVVSDLNSIIVSEVSWWDLEPVTEIDKVYWANYTPKRPSDEREFRIMVTKDQVTYFLTSGYFSKAHYERE
jgi:hypothetical protein